MHSFRIRLIRDTSHPPRLTTRMCWGPVKLTQGTSHHAGCCVSLSLASKNSLLVAGHLALGRHHVFKIFNAATSHCTNKGELGSTVVTNSPKSQGLRRQLCLLLMCHSGVGLQVTGASLRDLVWRCPSYRKVVSHLWPQHLCLGERPLTTTPFHSHSKPQITPNFRVLGSAFLPAHTRKQAGLLVSSREEYSRLRSSLGLAGLCREGADLEEAASSQATPCIGHMGVEGIRASLKLPELCLRSLPCTPGLPHGCPNFLWSSGAAFEPRLPSCCPCNFKLTQAARKEGAPCWVIPCPQHGASRT